MIAPPRSEAVPEPVPEREGAVGTGWLAGVKKVGSADADDDAEEGDDDLCHLNREEDTDPEARPVPPLPRCLTVVACTSPIPSHPSIALLEASLASLAQCTGGLDRCNVVVVCDGFTIDDEKPQSKWGRVTTAAARNYEQAKAALRDRPPGPALAFELIELPTHHGFARAVLAAVRAAVTTELCMVLQHDWLMMAPGFDAVGAATAMLRHPELLPYVGAQSLSTVDYRERALRRHGVDVEPRTLALEGLRFVPLLMLQDKPFIARSDWLVELCNATPLGKFPEDTVGQEQLRAIRADGFASRATNRLYATFVLEQGVPTVYHLSGRKARRDASVKAAPDVAATVDGGTRRNGVALRGRSQVPDGKAAGFVRGAVFGHAVVAGLGLGPGSGGGLLLPKQRPKGKFKGRCFVCGDKGHSKEFCSAEQAESSAYYAD